MTKTKKIIMAGLMIMGLISLVGQSFAAPSEELPLATPIEVGGTVDHWDVFDIHCHRGRRTYCEGWVRGVTSGDAPVAGSETSFRIEGSTTQLNGYAPAVLGRSKTCSYTLGAFVDFTASGPQFNTKSAGAKVGLLNTCFGA